jgi:hypothetical protein
MSQTLFGCGTGRQWQRCPLIFVLKVSRKIVGGAARHVREAPPYCVGGGQRVPTEKPFQATNP